MKTCLAIAFVLSLVILQVTSQGTKPGSAASNLQRNRVLMARLSQARAGGAGGAGLFGRGIMPLLLMSQGGDNIRGLMLMNMLMGNKGGAGGSAQGGMGSFLPFMMLSESGGIF